MRLHVHAAALAVSVLSSASQANNREQLAQLGAVVFADTGLSRPAGTACASCHAVETGYTFSRSGIRPLAGLEHQRIAPPLARNSQTIAYSVGAASSPRASVRSALFWDGRSHSLEEQALGPLYSPHEMNIENARVLCEKALGRHYRSQILNLLNLQRINCKTDEIKVQNLLTTALAEFQISPTVNRFSSKFDRYIRNEATLTAAEAQGLRIASERGCFECHSMKPKNAPLFSDFGFHASQFPSNLDLVELWVKLFGNRPNEDFGLAAATGDSADRGKFKTPTLRNVTKKPFRGFERVYGHNGAFISLHTLLKLHSTIPVPSLGQTPNAPPTPLGDNEIVAVVEFLHSLEDR